MYAEIQSVMNEKARKSLPCVFVYLIKPIHFSVVEMHMSVGVKTQGRF